MTQQLVTGKDFSVSFFWSWASINGIAYITVPEAVQVPEPEDDLSYNFINLLSTLLCGLAALCVKF